MSAAKLHRNIMRYLQLHGFKVYKISNRFHPGIPNLYAVRNGKHYWFVVMAPGAKLSKIQVYEIRQLCSYGAPATVVRSVEDVWMALPEAPGC